MNLLIAVNSNPPVSVMKVRKSVTLMLFTATTTDEGCQKRILGRLSRYWPNWSAPSKLQFTCTGDVALWQAIIHVLGASTFWQLELYSKEPCPTHHLRSYTHLVAAGTRCGRRCEGKNSCDSWKWKCKLESWTIAVVDGESTRCLSALVGVWVSLVRIVDVFKAQLNQMCATLKRDSSGAPSPRAGWAAAS